MLTPLALWLVAHAAPVADLFVDAGAANCAQADGSAAAPVCTITQAVALAQPGDTIRIAPGLYSENLVLTFDLELIGSAGAPVTTIDGGGSGSVVDVTSAITVLIDGLTLQGGSALSGGGVDVPTGSLTLTDSVIRDCEATGVGGGAIASLVGGTVVLRNSTVTSCATRGSGGGIAVQGGALEIYRSTVELCTSDGPGGGVHAMSADVLIQRSSLLGNQTLSSGGALALDGSTGDLRNSTLAGGGSATFGGGGLWSETSLFALRNCTLSGTTAAYGGALHTSGAPLVPGTPNVVSNSTITACTASSFGGGVSHVIGSAPLHVRNTVIAGNSVSAVPATDLDVYGELTSLGHNLIGTGAAGFADGVLSDRVGSPGAPLDPRLGPLADNGGPTGTHEPLAGSPLFSAGDLFEFEPVDQRGVPRIQGFAPEIGSFEVLELNGDFCEGDGADAFGCGACPCGNDAAPGTIGGCLNSTGEAARLVASGSVSIAVGDLRFEAVRLPSSSFAVLTSGVALAPQNPANPCFGTATGLISSVLDGLRCAVTSTLRHGGRAVASDGTVGESTPGWGPPDGPPGGLPAQGSFQAGSRRFFQAFYRELPAAVCATEQNTTQAIACNFLP